MIYQRFSIPRFLMPAYSLIVLSALLVGSISLCPAQEPPPAEGGDALAAAQFQVMVIAADYVENEENRAAVRATINRQMGYINEIIRGSRSLSGNEANLERWFGSYIFPRMTQLETLGQLDMMRVDFFKRYLLNVQYTMANNNVDTHTFLVNYTLQTMQDIVEGNYHPAVRFNAMLVIGRLNDVEMFNPNTGDRIVPVPSRQALGFMVGQLEKPDQRDALQLGAWIGIQRHTTLDRYHLPQVQIPEQGKTIVRGLATQLIQLRDPPPGRSSEGHVWLQRRGIDVLAMLGTDPDSQVLSTIGAFTVDEDSPMSLRLTAARSLSGFQYDAQTTIAAVPAAHALGALAAQACRNEIARVEEAKKRKNRGQDAGGGSMDMAGGGMGGMDSMMAGGGGMGDDMSGMFGGGTGGGAATEEQLKPEEATSVQYTRRRLKYQLFYVQQGLGTGGESSSGLMMAADAEGQTEVQKVVDAVDEIMKVLAEPELAPKKVGDKKPRKPIETVKLDDVLKEVRKKTRDLEALVVKTRKPVLPGAGPAADAPGADAPGADAPGGN
ncbi:MAG: hypothetical protein VB817_00915 [Pirellulaceae bacterium]